MSSHCKPSCTPTLSNGRGNMPSTPKRPVLPQQQEIPPWYTLLARKSTGKYGITKDKKVTESDDVLVEQLYNIGSKANRWVRWLLAMLNKCFMENKIPTIWRQSQIIAIQKPWKDCNSKELATISLVCQTYTLYARMIRNRISPTIELHLIKEQTGFRHGKSFTGQLLNITKHIQDGYQKSPIDHQRS